MKGNKQTLCNKAIVKLTNIVSLLRSQKHGCPWYIKQTHKSLIPYVIEEAYEVADAIRNGGDENMQEELGDLLLQVVLHSQIANEENRFSLTDVAQGISEKLIRRHPTVFKKIQNKNMQSIEEDWERIKLHEKPISNSKSPISQQLIEKTKSQDGLSGAMKISKKAAKLGFEWQSFEDLWSKLEEEINEFKYELISNDTKNQQEELGDIFFTLVNIARWKNLDPQEAIIEANKKFLKRFSYVEASKTVEFKEMSYEKLQKLWNNAKYYFKSL